MAGVISNTASKQKACKRERRLLKYSVREREKEIGTLPGKLSHMVIPFGVPLGRGELTKFVAFATCFPFFNIRNTSVPTLVPQVEVLRPLNPWERLACLFLPEGSVF